MHTEKQKKQSKKAGRNKAKCQKYRLLGIREKNKTRRIAKEKRRQARLAARKAS